MKTLRFILWDKKHLPTTPPPFVGPLLEGLDAEKQGDVEREGVYWDLRTLGADWPSIQEALQKLGMKGIRQWVVPPVGARIDRIESGEIVDPSFLQQVASQAAIFVGGGDHGFFYQALFKGIPVIGLPTNGTKGYFIDRLQSMGLGIKLSYRDFTRPTALVQSVEGLLNHYAIFARRCRAFAVDIQEWQDANCVADMIDGYWMSRTEGGQLDRYYQVSQRDFVRQLSLSTVLSDKQVEEMLKNGRNRQMPHEVRQDGIFLALHRRDAFALRYMETIGHLEFGEALRPIDFDGWLTHAGLFSHREQRAFPYMEGCLDSSTPDFWVDYWTAAYSAVLRQAGPRTVLFSYD